MKFPFNSPEHNEHGGGVQGRELPRCLLRVHRLQEEHQWGEVHHPHGPALLHAVPRHQLRQEVHSVRPSHFRYSHFIVVLYTRFWSTVCKSLHFKLLIQDKRATYILIYYKYSCKHRYILNLIREIETNFWVYMYVY